MNFATMNAPYFCKWYNAFGKAISSWKKRTNPDGTLNYLFWAHFTESPPSVHVDFTEPNEYQYQNLKILNWLIGLQMLKYLAV